MKSKRTDIASSVIYNILSISVIIIAIIVFVSVSCKRKTAENTNYIQYAVVQATCDNGNLILKDENGRYWEVSDYQLENNTRLMLDMFNGETPKDTTDDRIVRIWQLVNKVEAEE